MSRNRILENTVVPFLPNHPNSCKPNNCEEQMRRSIHATHLSELSKVMSKLTRMHKIHTKPSQYLRPQLASTLQWRNKYVADSDEPHLVGQAVSDT